MSSIHGPVFAAAVDYLSQNGLMYRYHQWAGTEADAQVSTERERTEADMQVPTERERKDMIEFAGIVERIVSSGLVGKKNASEKLKTREAAWLVDKCKWHMDAERWNSLIVESKDLSSKLVEKSYVKSYDLRRLHQVVFRWQLHAILMNPGKRISSRVVREQGVLALEKGGVEALDLYRKSDEFNNRNRLPFAHSRKPVLRRSKSFSRPKPPRAKHNLLP